MALLSSSSEDFFNEEVKIIKVAFEFRWRKKNKIFTNIIKGMSDLWGGTVILRPSGAATKPSGAAVGVANNTRQIFSKSRKSISNSLFNSGIHREAIRNNIEFYISLHGDNQQHRPR